MELENLTIKDTAKAFRNGDFSPSDLVKAYLAEMEKKDKDLHSYLEVFDDCLEQAKIADKKIKEGEKSLLCGIPFSIKDNILIEGRVASAGSKILENYKATYDATAIKKLKDAGAIFIGRTNMDEFAMGGSTENSAYGVTKNPKDNTRVAGGSSGGAASSVSANMCLAGLGSDTGGSVRQPASFCGVVGLKPTYGSISRHGLMAMGSSLDQIGPIGKSVEDVEIIFNEIKGQDKYDGTTFPQDFYGEKKIGKKIKIGVPRSFTKTGLDKEVASNFDKSLELLEKAGYEIKDVEVPSLKHSLSAYYVIMPAEVSSNMARYDGMKFGSASGGDNLLGDYMKTRGSLLGKEVRRRIIIGTYVLSAGYYDAYYGKAIEVRNVIACQLAEIFKDVDAIVTPTSPFPAFKIGEKVNDPLAMYLADIFTVGANISGVPAISIPSGVTKTGLPLGIQFMSGKGCENTLFEIGKKFETMRVSIKY